MAPGPAQPPHLPASQVLAQPRARCIAEGTCHCLRLHVCSSVEGGKDLVWFLNFYDSVLSLEILVTFTALTLGHTAGKKKKTTFFFSEKIFSLKYKSALQGCISFCRTTT